MFQEFRLMGCLKLQKLHESALIKLNLSTRTKESIKNHSITFTFASCAQKRNTIPSVRALKNQAIYKKFINSREGYMSIPFTVRVTRTVTPIFINNFLLSYPPLDRRLSTLIHLFESPKWDIIQGNVPIHIATLSQVILFITLMSNLMI